MNRKAFALRRRWVFPILLALIVSLGAALRFYGLTIQSYWLDEIFSASFSSPDYGFDRMLDIVLHDMHPPFYQSLLWVWYQWFGDSEYAGRVLSALAGTLAVPATYLLAKALFNRPVALYAAAIAAVNPFLIHYAQEVRSYALFYLLGTLSYYFFVRTLSQPSKTNALLYWLSTILVFYTHYYGAILIFTQLLAFVYVVIKTPQERRRLIRTAVLTAVVLAAAAAPLLPYVAPLAGVEHFWIEKPSILFPAIYFKKFFGSWIVFFLFAGLALYALRDVWRASAPKRIRTALGLLLIWVIAGVAVPYVRSITATPMMMPRYTIFVLPALILIVAYGFWKLRTPARRPLFALGIAVSLLYLYTNYYTAVVKEQWRDALQAVARHDAVPVYSALPMMFRTYTFAHYAKMMAMELEVRNVSELEEAIASERIETCFWVLDAHIDHIAKTPLPGNDAFAPVTTEQFHYARAVLYAHGAERRTLMRTADVRTPALRVMFVLPSMVQGGAGRVAASLSGRLAALGIACSIVVLRRETFFYALDERVELLSAVPRGENENKIVGGARAFFSLLGHARRWAPDVMIGFQTYSAVMALGTGRLYGCPVIVSERESPRQWDGHGSMLLALRDMLYKGGAGFWAQTREAADAARRWQPEGQIRVIANPARPITPHPELPPEKIVLNVGRLDPRKGQKELIELFARIEAPEWKLVILGEGWIEQDLKAVIAVHGLEGRVRLEGAVRDVDSWLARASIFAFPSHAEGFPNALIEAMCAGLPCISYDCDTGPRDLIRHDENGILVPVGDTQAFADALRHLMEEPKRRRTLGEAARGLAARLDEAQIASELAEFCRDVAGRAA